MPNFGMTHAIIAAYVRTVAKYPAVNRFVAGQRICVGWSSHSTLLALLNGLANANVSG